MLKRPETITHRVLILNDISQAAIEKLERSGSLENGGCNFVVGRDLKDFDTVILRSAPFNADEHPDVKLVVRAGTEANKVTGTRVDSGQTCVQLTLGANSQAVAEEVIGAVIILARKLPEAIDFVRNLDYSKPAKEFDAAFESGKSKFVGRELSSLTLGVVGVGQIGSRVVKMALLLGMRVIVFEQDRLSATYWLLPSGVAKADTIEEVLEHADVVTVHVPGEGNKHLIGEDRMRKMRKGAHLINCARREICDGTTILSALNDERLGGYFSDFPDQVLPSHPKIICVPHLGGNTVEAQELCGEMAVEQVLDFWRRGNVWPSKNWPSVVVTPAESAVMRLAIPHHNREGVLAPIQKIIADAHVNISTNENKTNKKFGYYVVDLDQPLPEQHIEQIREMEAVIDVMTFYF